MIQTTRKCKHCKELIVLEDYDFILQKDTYFHCDCFVRSLVEKKKGGVSEEEAKEIAAGLKEESIKNTKELIIRNKLCKWLQRTYDIVFLPTYFFVKMDSVYNGTYKNLSEGVCAEDLYDMWQRKIDYLNKTAEWKNSRGEKMEGLNRLWYDLAILMSKVGSYKKWKEECKVIENQNKVINTPENINFNLINNITSRVIEHENEETIADFLEEI
jgi:hypothetical protein